MWTPTSSAALEIKTLTLLYAPGWIMFKKAMRWVISYLTPITLAVGAILLIIIGAFVVIYGNGTKAFWNWNTLRISLSSLPSIISPQAMVPFL